MKAIIHIGQTKNGSTQLQFFLEKNREKLIIKGILVPKSLGNKKHISLIRDSDQLSDNSSSNVQAFQKELRESPQCQIHLLTEENLFVCKPFKKASIKEFLHEFYTEIELVVYLQRQELHMPIQYQQAVNAKGFIPFEDWIRRMIKNKFYSYDLALTAWRDLLPQAKIHIVPFYNLDGSNVINKILEIGGIYDFSDFDYNTPNNYKSLDPKSIELLRLMNFLKFKKEKKLDEKFRANLKDFLLKITSNKKLELTEAQNEYVFHKTHASNQAFVEKYGIVETKDISYFLDPLATSSRKETFSEDEVLSLLVQYIGSIN